MADATDLNQRRDDASMLLGMAYGVAHICCGAAEEVDDEPGDITDVVMGLRHITGLVSEAKNLVHSIAGPAEHVARALAVCTLAAADIGVERDGRYRQHWNGEITAWGLHSICDVIERAKGAVDEREDATEVSHG